MSKQSCKIKLCGLQTIESVALAAKLGVDAVGFVLSPSPRQVTATAARELRKHLPASITVHGVVGPLQPHEIRTLFEDSGVDIMQIHSSSDVTDEFWSVLSGIPILRAYRVKGLETLAQIKADAQPRFLLDAYVPGQSGGTGTTFDWDLARQAGAHGEVILAGGLTPENVTDAITQARPWMVDVSGGIESEKGVKSLERMRSFVEIVRNLGQ